MENKILITGSSGTIGSALCIKLATQKKKFIPLDIKPFLWDDKIDKKTIRFDLRKSLTKTKLPFKPNMIIHLAANARVHDLVVNPKLALDNYMMTHNILEYARLNKIEKFIYASSREVYGESSKPKRKENDTHISNIKSPYTASKFGAEAMVHAYHECYGIKPVIIRFSNVYGRYDISERVVPLFIYYALRNRDIYIFGKGKKLDF
ncbi:MAG: NAD-dependent epimerase/dehydratase family protein, partial [candidate division Zixibacteria bacterium]|nr:NAD-dependent epimerase/dehydratase family protein [candidate division Zixibacteria bacterium]